MYPQTGERSCPKTYIHEDIMSVVVSVCIPETSSSHAEISIKNVSSVHLNCDLPRASSLPTTSQDPALTLSMAHGERCICKAKYVRQPGRKESWVRLLAAPGEAARASSHLSTPAGYLTTTGVNHFKSWYLEWPSTIDYFSSHTCG